MATTIVIKIRNGEVVDIISNDFDVKVITADYDVTEPYLGTDPHGEKCRVIQDAAAEDPKEVGEFIDIIERRREEMRRGLADD